MKAQLRQVLLADERLLGAVQHKEETKMHGQRRSVIGRLASPNRESEDIEFMSRLEYHQQSLVIPRFDQHGKYPCYVMDLETIKNLEILPTHEEALRLNLLEVLSRGSDQPNPAHTFFVSQNWEGENGEHPDNEENTKLNFLKRLRQHCAIGERRIWIWFDIFSIPQADRRKQLLAIDSIQY